MSGFKDLSLILAANYTIVFLIILIGITVKEYTQIY
jgi:hypothetical protein